MKKRFPPKLWQGKTGGVHSKKGRAMRNLLLERQLRERERILERSILLNPEKRDEYIINKEKMKQREELGELYQRKRRALG